MGEAPEVNLVVVFVQLVVLREVLLELVKLVRQALCIVQALRAMGSVDVVVCIALVTAVDVVVCIAVTAGAEEAVAVVVREDLATVA